MSKRYEGPLIVDAPLSDAERMKRDSHFLRGTIADDLKDGLTGGFHGDNFLLIRFHGTYQQDDRDIRRERKEQKLEPRYAMMLRCRLPGGIISPQHWLKIDEYASTKTLYGSIRLTNRQTFQFHGILKGDLKSVHRMLHDMGLDSIATANDVNRNVMCTSNPVESELHAEAYALATRLSEHLLPKTRAYADIWLDKEKVASTVSSTLSTTDSTTDSTTISTTASAIDEEPILGATYLPRKFKTTVVIPPLNDVDLHANDMNFVAIAEQGHLIGFNLLLGGGLAYTHGDTTTFPSTATEVGYVPLEKVLDVAEAVVTTQRDWGNRSNRRQARTKYTLERVGIDRFKAEVERRAEMTFAPIRPYAFTERGDRFGWVKGIDDKWHLTLFIESGRLIDSPELPIKSGVAEIAKVHKGDFRLTANQNLIVAGVPEAEKETIERIARDHGLLRDVTHQRLNSMACVSFPTCPLAMAEAERYLPHFIDEVDALMARHGLRDEHIVLRITGCPNNCGRAVLGEVGLVGKAPGRYNLHIGGNRIGNRISRLYRENIQEPDILAILDDVIGRWAAERQPGEGFGDFVVRTGVVVPVRDSAIDFYAISAN